MLHRVMGLQRANNLGDLEAQAASAVPDLLRPRGDWSTMPTRWSSKLTSLLTTTSAQRVRDPR